MQVEREIMGIIMMPNGSGGFTPLITPNINGSSGGQDPITPKGCLILIAVIILMGTILVCIIWPFLDWTIDFEHKLSLWQHYTKYLTTK